MSYKYYLKDIMKFIDFPFKIEKTFLKKDYHVHSHDFSELVIVTSGSAKHIIDEEVFDISAGDVYVLKEGTAHGIKEVESLEIWNIMYYSEMINEVNYDIKKLPGFQALFFIEPLYRKTHSFKSRLSLSYEKLAYVKDALNQMLTEYSTGIDGYQTAIWAYFMTLVVFLSREYSKIDTPLAGQLFKLAQSVSYIEKNYTKPISVKELSEMAFLSERHYNRVFKLNYGTTPINYIIELRIRHACALLSRSTMPVIRIALESGFNDSNYFSRLFKMKMGLTPAEFRNQSFQV